MRKLLLLLMLLPIGCVKNVNPPPLPAGFLNQYDQDIFNGLITAQAAIIQAKSSFGANPDAKTSLNRAINTYNDTRIGYLAWHDAAVKSSSTDHSRLDQLMSLLLSAIAVINQQFGVKSPQPVHAYVFDSQRLELQEAL